MLGEQVSKEEKPAESTACYSVPLRDAQRQQQQRRAKMTLPPKRPTHGSAVSLHSIGASVRSTNTGLAGRTVKSADSAAVRRHSIGFFHDDDSTSYRSEGSVTMTSGLASVTSAVGLDDSDVMDIRDSGMVSLGSTGSIDGRVASELFQVAGGGGRKGAGTDRGLGSGGGGEATPPDHWRSPTEHWQSPSSLEQRRARMTNQMSTMDQSLPGEREQAYAALMSMMRGGTSNVSEMGDPDKSYRSRGGAGMRRITSFASLNTGFWSAMEFQRSNSHPDSDDQLSAGGGSAGSDKSKGSRSKTSVKSKGSGKSGGSEYSTMVTYGKERRRLRRQLFLRKCAIFMATLAALAALSMSAVYYVGKDNLLRVVDSQVQKYQVLLQARRESVNNGREENVDGDVDDKARQERAERRRRAQKRAAARRALSPEVGGQYSPEDGGVDYAYVP